MCDIMRGARGNVLSQARTPDLRRHHEKYMKMLPSKAKAFAANTTHIHSPTLCVCVCGRALVRDGWILVKMKI